MHVWTYESLTIYPYLMALETLSVTSPLFFPPMSSTEPCAARAGAGRGNARPPRSTREWPVSGRYKRLPHFSQNFAPGRISAEQYGQTSTVGASVLCCGGRAALLFPAIMNPTAITHTMTMATTATTKMKSSPSRLPDVGLVIGSVVRSGVGSGVGLGDGLGRVAG